MYEALGSIPIIEGRKKRSERILGSFVRALDVAGLLLVLGTRKLGQVTDVYGAELSRPVVLNLQRR
jgi:hypothetical protein